MQNLHKDKNRLIYGIGINKIHSHSVYSVSVPVYFRYYTEQMILKKKKNSGQLIFKYVFSKIFHYNHRCDQQNYISLEVVTRPFSKKHKMSNKD